MKEKFEKISQLLDTTRYLWQPAPFKQLFPGWEKKHPELSDYLLSLTDQEVSYWHYHIEEFCVSIERFLPFAKAVNELSSIPSLKNDHNDEKLLFNHQSNERENHLHDVFFKVGIKQRKWQQVNAFANQLPTNELPLLEWCAGKGYLAKWYGLNTKKPVSCVEIDARLCEQGQTHAKQFSIDAQFIQADVLNDSTDQFFKAQQQVVALHACGDLHIKLIEQSIKHRPAFFALSPCCYHLIEKTVYQPLSELGKINDLTLSHNDIRIALEEHVTGSQRELEQTMRLNKRRLILDEYCRAKNNHDIYTPFPTVSKAWANKPLDDCLRRLAEKKGIVLESHIDWKPYIVKADKRFDHYQRFSLVRYLFRRLIELWLVYDRAIYLEENGYKVSVGEFCEKNLSPRNIMIIAKRRDE